MTATWHDHVVQCDPSPKTPAVGRGARESRFRTLFESNERVSFTPVNPEFRVLGTTGIVWYSYVLEVRPKEGPATKTEGLATDTYVLSNGEWLRLMAHRERTSSR